MTENEKGLLYRKRKWLAATVPFGVIVAVFDLVTLSFDALLTAGDLLFIPVSVVFGSVAGNVDWISRATLQPVVVWLGLLYASNLLIENLTTFKNGDNE